MSANAERNCGVILLGASRFPYKQGLDKPSFSQSKTNVAAVLTVEYLLAKNVAQLDLFDTECSPAEVVERVHEFLDANKGLTDVIIYYCGHGGFLPDRTYYLTLRTTRNEREATTGLLFRQFRLDLENVLCNKRTYLVLDCCYAASAVRDWMSDKNISAVIADQIEAVCPPSGTALFVAASQTSPAIAPDGQDTTLFSGHFVEAIRAGIHNDREELSLVDLADCIRGRIRNEPVVRQVMPELHVPRQQKGDVSRWPLVRNRGVIRPKKEESSGHSAGWFSPLYTGHVTVTMSPPGTRFGLSSGENSSEQLASQMPATPPGETGSEKSPVSSSGNSPAQSASQMPAAQPGGTGSGKSPRSSRQDEASPPNARPQPASPNKETTSNSHRRKTNKARHRKGEPEIQEAKKIQPRSNEADKSRRAGGPPGDKPILSSRALWAVAACLVVLAGATWLVSASLPWRTSNGAGDQITSASPDLIPRLPPERPNRLDALARSFLNEFMRQSQGSAADYISYARRIYQPEVLYFGKVIKQDQVIKESQGHISRWPQRTYVLKPETTQISCNDPEASCRISGQIDFRSENPPDSRISAGVASYDLKVLFTPSGPKITEENGHIISRQASAAPSVPAQSEAMCSPTAVREKSPSAVGGPYIPVQIKPDFSSANPLRAVLFSPDRTKFATAGDDGRIRIWNASSFKLEKLLRGHNGPVRAIAYSPNGALLASAGFDRTIRIWDTAVGEELYRFDDIQQNAHSVVFSPGTKTPYVVAGFDEGLIGIWNLTTQKIASTRNDPGKKPVRSLSFAPGESGTFVSANQGTIWQHVWGKETKPIAAHSGAVFQVSYSADGQRILTAGYDGKLKIWNASDLMQAPRTTDAQAKYMTAAAWSPDGNRLVSGGADKTIWLWDAQTLRQLKVIGRHAGDIEGIAFHPDGKRLLSVSEDKTLKIWNADLRFQNELLTIIPFKDEQYVAYTPDSCYFGSADVDQLFKVSAQGVEREISADQKRLMFRPGGFIFQAAAK